MNKSIFSIGVFLAVLFLIIMANSYSANAFCHTFISPCIGDNKTIVKLQDTSNSHIELVSQLNYPKYVCCDNLDLALSGGYTLIRLSGLTNAHADITGDSVNYPIQVNVTKPVYYVFNDSGEIDGINSCYPGTCVMMLSNLTNAHADSCWLKNYFYSVCIGGTGGFDIEMSCGRVFIGGEEFDKACNDSVGANPPVKKCPISNDCVFADQATGLNEQCHNLGSIETNINGKSIVCSNNNTWCPLGMEFNIALGRCDYPLKICNYGYNNPAFAPPFLLCNDIPIALKTYSESCFYDFNIVTTSFPPFNESCCFDYEWTNNSNDFSFYTPSAVIVY